MYGATSMALHELRRHYRVDQTEHSRIMDTLKNVIGRVPNGKAERERCLKQLRDEAPAWLKETWASSERRGTDKLTMREIDAEIAAVRRERGKTLGR